MTKPGLVVDRLILRTATEKAEIESLREILNHGHSLKAGRPAGHVLQGLTDTRNPKAIRHPFSAMLTLLVYGLICGAQDVKSIWRKCAPLDQN